MSDKQKVVETVSEAIVGNCSKCNGPVISKNYLGSIKVDEYQECLNCGAKRFPVFGKIIPMEEIIDPKVAPIIEKDKKSVLKDCDDYKPGINDNSLNPYNTPVYPNYPGPYRDPYYYPYNTPVYPNYPTTPWITYCLS